TRPSKVQEKPQNCKTPQEVIQKKPWCSYCNIKGHTVSTCPAVRKLDERCTMILRTLTSEQIEV
ncbi:16805_t:CDS:1, partial [Dentiscutata heterogama]